MTGTNPRGKESYREEGEIDAKSRGEGKICPRVRRLVWISSDRDD